MKSSRGFTLIELLIVIAIIGILMALLFPAVQGAIDAARRAQAKNDVTQIATAVNAYVTEYGKLPPGTDGTTVIGEGMATPITSNNLIGTLMGTATNANPRGLVFLEVNNVKDGSHKTGLNPDGKFVDPWGAPYSIAMDVNYDNQVTITYNGSNVTLRKTVAVCSGPTWTDGAPTNKTTRRFVNSWE